MPEVPTGTPLPVWADDVPADVATNDYDNRRLFVVVMDDAMILNDPGMTRGSVQIANTIVDRLGPNDLMAVVFTRDNRGAQDFTSDKPKLRASIAQFRPGTAFMDPSAYAPKQAGRQLGVNTDAYAYASSLHTLKEAADALIAIPDRRKALVYIGEGVPVDPDQAGDRGRWGTVTRTARFTGICSPTWTSCFAEHSEPTSPCTASIRARSVSRTH